MERYKIHSVAKVYCTSTHKDKLCYDKGETAKYIKINKSETGIFTHEPPQRGRRDYKHSK